jgi:photosystem II stability/assembly factor-like uncharacterized protein
VPGAEALQFRDVQAFSASVAFLMSIGASGDPTDFRIYKTEDGGATWTIQFENQNPNPFYDGFAFWTHHRGIAHSDSVNGGFPDLRTTDGTTSRDISNNMPPASLANSPLRRVVLASQPRVEGTPGFVRAGRRSPECCLPEMGRHTERV